MACTRGCCATQAEHYRCIVFGGAPTAETLRERALDKDLSAFKAAAQTGTRLRTFSGAAELTSRAQSPVEIERGHLIRNPRLLREMESHAASAPPLTTTPTTEGG